MPRTLVGVDLGGTLIRAAVVTGPAAHAEPARRPTPHDQGAAAVLDAVAAAVREAAAGRVVDGVAIGIPGPLDPRTGIVYEAPNIHGWEDLPAAQELSRRLDGCEVVIQNDANLAGYAEWIAGAGRGTRDFVFITISTGVGGGLVLDGELFAGSAGTAGEVGHVVVSAGGPACGQGHPGCLEGIASGTAIAHRAQAALDAGEPSSLRDHAGPLDAVAVEHAARAGDPLARRIFAQAGEALGLAIGGLINVLSPEVVAIGGGLSQAGELIFEPARAAIPRIAFPQPAARCRIVPAALGTDAGLVGAVAWATRRMGDG